MMPEMTGIEILDEVKKDADLKDIPIVMLTNLTWVPDPSEPLKHGALEVWVKSHHRPKDVVEKVKVLLKSKKWLKS